MRRVCSLVALTLSAAAIVSPSADAALFFLFNPTSAKPGSHVSIRTGGTPLRFRSSQRVRPSQQPIRLFLVANDVALEVTSPQTRERPAACSSTG